MKGKVNSRPRVHLLLLTKQFDPEVLVVLDQIVRLLEGQPGLFEYYFSDTTNIERFATLRTSANAILFQTAEHEKLIDYILTIGGDGTILFAAGHFQNRAVPPIISFAKGTVGFLCNFDLHELEGVITGVVETAVGKRTFLPKMLETKMRLMCTLSGHGKQSHYHCFNEIAVQKAEISHQVRLEVYIG